MSNVIEHDFTLVEQEPTKLLCPFRPTTRNVQVSQAEMDQILDFPECYYKQCPFFDSNNSIKCLKAESVLCTTI